MVSYLQSVSSGIDAESPVFVFIYGGHGLGKTCFVAAAPEPLIIDGENGTRRISTSRVTLPDTVEQFFEMLDEFIAGPFPFKTLAIDPMSELERLIWRRVVDSARVTDSKINTIEDLGYGKGYFAADEYWRKALAKLEAIRAKHGAHIILTDAERIAKFKNPAGEDWQYYRPAIHDRAAALFAKKCEALLYAHKRMFADSVQGKKTIGIAESAHMIATQGSSSFDAKNRFGLPPRIPLSWSEFWHHYTSPDTPAKLRDKISAALVELNDVSFSERVQAKLGSVEDTAKLKTLLNTIQAKLGAKQE